jgi:integrase
MSDFVDDEGKRRRVSLGHADKRKAERQRAQKVRELRMGVMAPAPMKLSDFTEDSHLRTGRQIRESTGRESQIAMKHLIEVIGDIDYQRVSFRHGELFRQTCLDQGNGPATVAKKLRHLKRLFQLAVDRRQLDENPLRRMKVPKSPKKKVEVFTADECERVLRVATDCETAKSIAWQLLIVTALTTGMRRGELLNAVWQDIDFDGDTIDVSPKRDTAQTWEWHIKDYERRALQLTEEVVLKLSDHQSRHPEGYPYVFVPPHRYERIQELRKQGKWTLCDSRQNLIHNFHRDFEKIQIRAGLKKLRRFHDLRSTAISNWFANGMKEFEVMSLAGHSEFRTTHQFYLAVADDLVDRARQATTQAMSQILARTWRAPSLSVGQKG